MTSLAASPDGATVAAALLLVDAGSGQVNQVAAADDGAVDGLAWSPGSGLYLAFISRRSFDPVYDAQTFDLSFPFGSRPYLVPLAQDTPWPFGPLPGGRPAGEDPGEDKGVPVAEARYSGLRAVKGGLAWLREPVAGVLGEGSAAPDDDEPRPVLERFDLRKREVTELAGELDWFAVSGDGTRVVVKDGGDLKVMPAERSSQDHEPADTVTVDLARARFTADPAGLWRHAYRDAG